MKHFHTVLTLCYSFPFIISYATNQFYITIKVDNCLLYTYLVLTSLYEYFKHFTAYEHLQDHDKIIPTCVASY